MRSIDVFRTRSYRVDPLGTLARSAEWLARSALRRTGTYQIEFGPNRFRLGLEAARRGYGSAGIFVQRRYYEPLLEFGHKLLNSGDRAIDGGANQGIFTCAFAAAVGPAGRVYAFEPQSYAVACIRNNLSLNGLDNVDIFEGALTDRAGETFLIADVPPVSAFTRSEPLGAAAVKVRSFAIDDLLQTGDIAEVQFLKLDVEGAELRTLSGAKTMLGAARPAICLEAWEAEQFGGIEALLGGFGYRAYVFDGRGNLNLLDRFVPSANVFFLR